MQTPLEADCYYHIYNRGNNRENLFVEDANYSFFLKRYAKYCYPVFDTFAYCLLINHFHLFIRVRSPKEVTQLLKSNNFDKDTVKRLSGKKWSSQIVSQQLGHASNNYTQAFNKKYHRTGSLFERPFERVKVGDQSYFCNLICYIHRNPQKHGIVDDYRMYPYSTYNLYLSSSKTKLNKEEAFKWFGGRENFIAVHENQVTLDKYKIE